MWQRLEADSYYFASGFGLLDIVSVFTLFLYVIMLVAVSVGIMVFLGIHFYKTMYTDEGYLTHTLPVTKNKLLAAKILVSGIWLLIVLVGVYASLFMLVNFMFNAVLPVEYSTWDFWSLLSAELGKAVEEAFEYGYGVNLTAYFIYIILTLVLGPFLTVNILFGAISLGQLFTKHRVLMAIVSYIGVLIMNGILGTIVEGIITTAHIGNSNGLWTSYFDTNLICGLILNIVVAVVMYLVSWFVSVKKLNME